MQRDARTPATLPEENVSPGLVHSSEVWSTVVLGRERQAGRQTGGQAGRQTPPRSASWMSGYQEGRDSGSDLSIGNLKSHPRDTLPSASLMTNRFRDPRLLPQTPEGKTVGL